MLDTLFQRPHHIRRLRANPARRALRPVRRVSAPARGQPAPSSTRSSVLSSTSAYWLEDATPAVTADQVTTASVAAVPAKSTCRTAPARRASRGPRTRRSAAHPPPSDAPHLQQDPPGCCHRRRRTMPSCPSTTTSSGRPAGCAEHTRIYRMRNARQFLQRHFGDGAAGSRPPAACRSPGLLPTPRRSPQARIGRRPG